MHRTHFNFAALLSLFLCATTAAMWVRSYYYGDFVHRFHSGTFHEIASCTGRLYLQTGATSYPDGNSWRTGFPTYVYVNYGNPDRWWAFIGFERFSGAVLNGVPGRRYSFLIVPYWPIVLLLSLTPAFWTFRRLTRRPLTPGRCRTCGYDLRATPETCPECGTVV